LNMMNGANLTAKVIEGALLRLDFLKEKRILVVSRSKCANEETIISLLVVVVINVLGRC
jgi:hypothetical protein